MIWDLKAQPRSGSGKGFQWSHGGIVPQQISVATKTSALYKPEGHSIHRQYAHYVEAFLSPLSLYLSLPPSAHYSSFRHYAPPYPARLFAPRPFVKEVAVSLLKPPSNDCWTFSHAFFHHLHHIARRCHLRSRPRLCSVSHCRRPDRVRLASLDRPVSLTPFNFTRIVGNGCV